MHHQQLLIGYATIGSMSTQDDQLCNVEVWGKKHTRFNGVLEQHLKKAIPAKKRKTTMVFSNYFPTHRSPDPAFSFILGRPTIKAKALRD